MKILETLRTWLIDEPGSGFLDLLARHGSVQASAPARWNAFVAEMNDDCSNSFVGVNDNQGAIPPRPSAKAA